MQHPVSLWIVLTCAFCVCPAASRPGAPCAFEAGSRLRVNGQHYGTFMKCEEDTMWVQKDVGVAAWPLAQIETIEVKAPSRIRRGDFFPAAAAGFAVGFGRAVVGGCGCNALVHGLVGVGQGLAAGVATGLAAVLVKAVVLKIGGDPWQPASWAAPRQDLPNHSQKRPPPEGAAAAGGVRNESPD